MEALSKTNYLGRKVRPPMDNTRHNKCVYVCGLVFLNLCGCVRQVVVMARVRLQEFN